MNERDWESEACKLEEENLRLRKQIEESNRVFWLLQEFGHLDPSKLEAASNAVRSLSK